MSLEISYHLSLCLNCLANVHISAGILSAAKGLWVTIVTFLPLPLGLPGGGLARSTHSSSSSDIKREDKEDDENSSVADKSEDEKKDSKVARSRTR